MYPLVLSWVVSPAGIRDPEHSTVPQVGSTEAWDHTERLLQVLLAALDVEQESDKTKFLADSWDHMIHLDEYSGRSQLFVVVSIEEV